MKEIQISEFIDYMDGAKLDATTSLMEDANGNSDGLTSTINRYL